MPFLKDHGTKFVALKQSNSNIWKTFCLPRNHVSLTGDDPQTVLWAVLQYVGSIFFLQRPHPPTVSSRRRKRASTRGQKACARFRVGRKHYLVTWWEANIFSKLSWSHSRPHILIHVTATLANVQTYFSTLNSHILCLISIIIPSGTLAIMC